MLFLDCVMSDASDVERIPTTLQIVNFPYPYCADFISETD